jgi:hypothetical protein
VKSLLRYRGRHLAGCLCARSWRILGSKLQFNLGSHVEVPKSEDGPNV